MGLRRVSYTRTFRELIYCLWVRDAIGKLDIFSCFPSRRRQKPDDIQNNSSPERWRFPKPKRQTSSRRKFETKPKNSSIFKLFIINKNYLLHPKDPWHTYEANFPPGYDRKKHRKKHLETRCITAVSKRHNIMEAKWAFWATSAKCDSSTESWTE